LAHALQLAGQHCAGEPPACVVLLTDGRANVAISGGDPWRETLAAAALLAPALAAALVIDCEPGPVRLGRAREIAALLGAETLALDSLDESQLTVHLRNRLSLP
jgi:magnesium chelatase subunit D